MSIERVFHWLRERVALRHHQAEAMYVSPIGETHAAAMKRRAEANGAAP